jgi:hypothetical protein
LWFFLGPPCAVSLFPCPTYLFLIATWLSPGLHRFAFHCKYHSCLPHVLFLVSQALQSNLKYSLLPRRLIISKRLAQCLHPALPSGVHLKALETYEIIFKIVGTKWLAKDLFLYRCDYFSTIVLLLPAQYTFQFTSLENDKQS